MSVLCVGSRGEPVRALQQALNGKLVPSPMLPVDGVFGAMTAAAVARFQAMNWLVEDGQAGPATQNALYGKETYPPIYHSVPFIPQPTPTQCWAASTAMMTNTTVPAVVARTPRDMVGADGGLLNSSEADQGMATGTRFGRVHGLRCFAPLSWMVNTLRQQLTRGPLMFDMLWNATDYVQGHASPGHMIVVVGMRGDDDPTGKGTTLRLHDPWPPGIPPNGGRLYSLGYFRWIKIVPTATYRVFAK
jgi:hypothetical protein